MHTDGNPRAHWLYGPGRTAQERARPQPRAGGPLVK